MKEFWAIPLGLVLGGLLLALPCPSFAYNGEKLEKGAKVKIEQARNIALQARAGTIADEELEHEKGGSGLRYSFDIKSGGGVFEVGVDARPMATSQLSALGWKVVPRAGARLGTYPQLAGWN